MGWRATHPLRLGPALQGDDLEVTAVSTQVVDRLRNHLQKRGLDIRAIMVTTGNRCTQ